MITLAFYGEGPTDYRFLIPIIERTERNILHTRGYFNREVHQITPLHPLKKHRSRADNILDIAIQARGHHLLIVHADADAPTRDRALAERIAPGLQKIVAAKLNPTIDLVPIIPVQMVEAWMLADLSTLEAVAGITKDAQRYLPRKSHLLERATAPKTLLQQVLKPTTASRRRHRAIKIADIQTPLGRQIDLTQLAKLPAYQQFEADLTQAFVDLKFIR